MTINNKTLTSSIIWILIFSYLLINATLDNGYMYLPLKGSQETDVTAYHLNDNINSSDWLFSSSFAFLSLFQIIRNKLD